MQTMKLSWRRNSQGVFHTSTSNRTLDQDQWRPQETSLLLNQSVTSLEWAPCFIQELKSRAPHISASTNSSILHQHGSGESSPLIHPVAPPDVVVKPMSTEDVQTIVQLCVNLRVPMIPYGAGTSLEGHVSAIQGGVCIDMTEMNQILHIPVVNSTSTIPDPIAVVQAGVTRSHLNRSLRHTGLQFVVDPGADATIGGTSACLLVLALLTCYMYDCT
jgi:hypothetical protein